MKRPPLSAVNVPPQDPGASLSSLISWAASASPALKALSTRQADHANAIDQMVQGQTIACGQVTLTANATTTTVTDDVIPSTALPILQAASGTWASTVMRVTAVAKGQFTITHSNEAAVDRVVYWFAPVPA